MSIIDADTNSPTLNTVIGTIAVGQNPYGVAFNPSYTKAYVTNRGDGTVTVIDAQTDAVIDTITVGGGPGAIAL